MKKTTNHRIQSMLFPLLGSVICFGASKTQAFPQQQPNILWISIEDTSPEFIGCYGNDDAKTPVIDKLAAEGVRFVNAYSTGTVCSASRSTIITGVRTFEMGTGNHRSNYNIPDFIKGFPYYLQQEGYYVSNNSKTDYNVGNVDQFTAEAWNESSNHAGWWNREPGQAFFSVFNFNDSHQSRTMSNSYEWYRQNVLEQLSENERISEEAFDMPPFFKDTPQMRKQFARVYNSIKLTDNKIGKLLEKLEADHLRDSTIIFFFADHGEGIPRAKTNGIKLGYRVPFVIWFPETYRHLSPWGTGGLISDELISFEDLAPTLISLAGGKIPEYMNGRILMGKNRSKETAFLHLSNDRVDNGPDLVRSITDGQYIYSRNYLSYLPEMRYIRYVEQADISKEMRLDLSKNALNKVQERIFKERPPEFLFDIEKDAWETSNLVYDSKFQKQLNQMRKKLEKNILESRDVHFLPEYEIALISQTKAPYTYRQNEDQYPLKEIYKAASLAGHRGSKKSKKQIRLLRNNNEIIRYWAIQGLRAQDIRHIKPWLNKIKASINDPYPPVSVIAAALIYQHTGDKDSENKLKKFCTSDNPEIARMAINQLLYIDNKQAFTEAVLMSQKKYEKLYKVKAACLDFLNIQETSNATIQK